MDWGIGRRKFLEISTERCEGSEGGEGNKWGHVGEAHLAGAGDILGVGKH